MLQLLIFNEYITNAAKAMPAKLPRSMITKKGNEISSIIVLKTIFV
jgi:hypothetical protein